MRTVDVLIVGAGPAGIAAATAAAERGRDVVVLDDNPAPGGQIWRGGVPSVQDGDHGLKQRALDRLERSGATLLASHRVFDVDPAASTLHVIKESGPNIGALSLRYRHLIVATGARERFLPFPGWTLPGVMGAGGLQALAKGGFPIAGKRIVVAGTGPLLLPVAAHLKSYGATVVSIAEQAALAQLAPFVASMWRQPAKLMQGAQYRAALRGTPYRTGCWPVEALTDSMTNQFRAVRLTDGKRTWEERCDLLACGFHLVPNNELAALCGCRLEHSFVLVDNHQRTSVAKIFCAGEPTGIAGLDAALLQGEIAGRTCAGAAVDDLLPRARRERAFAMRLNNAFALRPELRSLAKPETIVCRCEDVSLARLRAHDGWTEAKLQTRCGMGPCQGRICGPAVETLFGWQHGSVRPPLFPVAVGQLCPAEDIESI